MSSISTIGVIAPASACKEGEQDNYYAGINFLKDLGLNVVLGDNVFSREDSLGLAGSTQERLDALYKVWSDSSVDVVLAARGGYGCVHLLPELDFAYLEQNPKSILGYSDLTALQTALYHKTNIQSFNTPMLSELCKLHEISKESFVNLLKVVPEKATDKLRAKDLPYSLNTMASVNGGAINNYQESVILGGNLTILCSLLGTEYFPDFTDKVLFLEEYEEPKYKTDRLLSQLDLAGVFAKVQAVVLGTPTKTEFAYDKLEQILAKYAKPLIKNVPVGHGDINLSIPLG